MLNQKKNGGLPKIIKKIKEAERNKVFLLDEKQQRNNQAPTTMPFCKFDSWLPKTAIFAMFFYFEECDMKTLLTITWKFFGSYERIPMANGRQNLESAKNATTTMPHLHAPCIQSLDLHVAETQDHENPKLPAFMHYCILQEITNPIYDTSSIKDQTLRMHFTKGIPSQADISGSTKPSDKDASKYKVHNLYMPQHLQKHRTPCINGPWQTPM